ncbi:hypothetical protein [Microbacterium sp. Root180]|uniref:hypothetical protein n=1 Tax=Microbacterium sp. Root180 TaxID=1736483 RepID=UPI0006FEB683|nr:hypothetical protein [Microbacterium sp. Root180]KRB36784.1 hypothetical protein ASD93_12175 [Microbacterium sp. Root180]
MTATEVTDFVQQMPAFRVHVWTTPQPEYAENLNAYRVEGARDVLEVIDWARSTHDDGRREVLAEVDTGAIFSGEEEERALIPLYGWRPPQPPTGDISFRAV